MTISNLTTEIKFDDVLDYLVVYIQGEIFDVFLNLKPINKDYIETFNNILQTDDPSKIAISFSDCMDKQIVNLLQVANHEAAENIEFEILDKKGMVEKHPWYFESD